MKTILTVLFTAAVLVGVLRTGLTPWRLVNKDDLHLAPPVVLQLAAPSVDRSGDWMRDPNYRTSLEKTTIVGRPEAAASRDTGIQAHPLSPHN